MVLLLKCQRLVELVQARAKWSAVTLSPFHLAKKSGIVNYANSLYIHCEVIYRMINRNVVTANKKMSGQEMYIYAHCRSKTNDFCDKA